MFNGQIRETYNFNLQKTENVLMISMCEGFKKAVCKSNGTSLESNFLWV